jgi:predicted outer membrane protein
MMRAAHLGSMHAVDVIAKETGIGRNTLAGELGITHLFSTPDSVGNASEQTIDRHYITEEITIHRHVLAELQLLQGVVRNRRAREHIDAAIPAVRDHLARAIAIAKARGFSWRRDVQ